VFCFIIWHPAQIMAKTSPKSGTAPGPDASAPDGPAALARAIEGGDVVGLTVRSMVTVATRRPPRQPAMRSTQAHLLTLSRLHRRLLPQPR